MKKTKNKNMKELLLKTVIVIETIIIIILLLRFESKKTIAFNGNGAKGIMGSIRAYSDELVTIENNKFTKEGYDFTGWNIYNDKDNTWKCEEGWFTEEEIKENEYKTISYTTEEINDYFNSMGKGKITAYANWRKSSEEKINSEIIDSNVSEQTDAKDENKDAEIIQNECERHFYFSKVTKKATCDHTGLRVFTCMMCKDTYSEEISKLEHEYTMKIIKPTCEKEGAKVFTCINCGNSYEEEIPAKGHSYIEKIIRIPNGKGKIVKLHICTECTNQYEEIIKQECIDHIYSSEITKEATCTENGIKTYTCMDCKETYTEEITAIGHEYNLEIKKATCEENGVKIYTCTNCNYRYTEEIPAIGHNYTEEILKEPTCSNIGTKGYLCLNCKSVYTEEIPKLKHIYAETVLKEPTHEETGIKKLECVDCGSSYEEEIAKLEYTDLEKLQRALIGRQFSEEEIGKELIIDDLLIKFDEILYFKKSEILNEIVYNNKKYTLFINTDGIGINVTENKDIDEKFKFDEWYSGLGDVDITMKINKNGDTTIYETSTLELQGKELEYAKVYQNNIYFKEDGRYCWVGNVNETGRTITIGEDDDLAQLIYNPDFEAKIKEYEEKIKIVRGYYSYLDDIGEESVKTAGMMIEEDCVVYICIELEDNRVMPFPIVEMYVKPGIYKAYVTDEGIRTITNPIYQKDYNGNVYLYGYACDEKIVLLDVEGSVSSNSYTKIEERETLVRIDFPCDKIKPEKTYKQIIAKDGMKTIVGINEAEGILYEGCEYYKKYFWFGGPSKYTIKEDFIAELEDGTTIDYTGKKVIFSQIMCGETFSVEENEYDPLGYIEGDKIILFEKSVSQRDENGFATKFYSIQLEDNGELQLE